MKIGIVGAGSLGMIAGAMITRAGYDCVLLDVNQAHVQALNEKGAIIKGKYEGTIPVEAQLIDETTYVYDILMLQTKQMHMEAALKTLEKNMHDETIVITLQNGVPEDRAVKIVGQKRVIGGTVFHGARYIEPGVSELTTDFECMHTYVGELDGSITPRLEKIKEILDSAGGGEITTDILGVKWTKLVMNCALSGISAALGCTFGEALENQESMKAMAYICNEGAQVMAAKNLIPVEMEGFLPTVENYQLENKAHLESIEKQLRHLISYSYDEVASMLQDIWAGRTQCEIDDINGKLVEGGKETGIDTPFNEKVVEIVTKVINKEIKPTFENLNYFQFPSLI